MSAASLKVLVIGSGGREHALCWKIAASPRVSDVVCAPGNAGTGEVARNVSVAATDLDGLESLCRAEQPDLVVIGPEDPLSLGLADRLRKLGTLVFGPGRAGARLESSKVFAKEFLDRQRIPTGAWRRFERAGAAKSYLESQGQWPQVIKADGLAAGKGVFVVADAREGCAAVDALMEQRKLGDAGREVVIEEFIAGRELSVLALADGSTLCLLEPVMDYKQAHDGDTGPNTGGIGLVSPVPFVTQRLMRQIESRVLLPALHGLRIEGIDYRGVVYAGLMITRAARARVPLPLRRSRHAGHRAAPRLGPRAAAPGGRARRAGEGGAAGVGRARLRGRRRGGPGVPGKVREGARHRGPARGRRGGGHGRVPGRHEERPRPDPDERRARPVRDGPGSGRQRGPRARLPRLRPRALERQVRPARHRPAAHAAHGRRVRGRGRPRASS